MSNVLAPYTKQQFFSNAGTFNAGGFVYTYAAGTNTPIATYTATGATNANPVVLDSRGSCDIWLLPNVGYKLSVTDINGNTLPGYPIDNIFNSQLLTLYAGVDTGGPNSYVVSYSANYTALANGIVLLFVASNTNTGPSTLTVNSTFGTQPIINQSGNPLGASQIQQGQIVEVMYYNGSWLLVNANQQSTGTVTFTYNGGVSALTGTGTYQLVGSTVTLYLPYLSQTSNNTLFTYSGLPAFLQPIRNAVCPLGCMTDNGNYVFGAFATLLPASGVINFNNSTSALNWTSSGTKACGFSVGNPPAQFNYANVITYSLL